MWNDRQRRCTDSEFVDLIGVPSSDLGSRTGRSRDRTIGGSKSTNLSSALQVCL